MGVQGPDGPTGPTGPTGPYGMTGDTGLVTKYFSALSFRGNFTDVGVHDLPHINFLFSNPAEQEIVTNILVETTPTTFTFKPNVSIPTNVTLFATSVAFQDANGLAWMKRELTSAENPGGYVTFDINDESGCTCPPVMPVCNTFMVLEWAFTPFQP